MGGFRRLGEETHPDGEEEPGGEPGKHLVEVVEPFSHVANVTTPTMMLSGTIDLRTPMGQAEEFYRALMVNGVETLHVKIPDEYHGTRAASHRLMIQLCLKAWFDRNRTDTGG